MVGVKRYTLSLRADQDPGAITASETASDCRSWIVAVSAMLETKVEACQRLKMQG